MFPSASQVTFKVSAIIGWSMVDLLNGVLCQLSTKPDLAASIYFEQLALYRSTTLPN